MAASLEQLATLDPPQAMALALAEANLRLRDDLRNAVLRGWASASPDAAAAWAMAQPAGSRSSVMEAVLAGAAHQPDQAIRLTAHLSAERPELASDFSRYLISGLTDQGAYASAAQFATADTSEHRTAWLNTAFYQWSAHQPQLALAAWEGMADPGARVAAFQGLVIGWASAAPSALAAYATALPPGENRQLALGQALTQWVGRDPAGASQWIDRFDPSGDLDPGVMAVATMPALAEVRPEVAVGWAQSIMDPGLRTSTLRTLALQWAQRDPAAARRYIATTAGLSSDDRATLLDGVNSKPGM